jgi:hypothetical protein
MVAANWLSFSDAVILTAVVVAGLKVLADYRGWTRSPALVRQENADPRFTPAVTTDHLEAEGIPHCVPAFGWGAWSDAPTYIPPAQYLGMWDGPFAVYFGDSREPQYGEWK